MIERVIFTEEADQDIGESYDWFEIREPGLGEEFLRCVETCLLTLKRHPQLYPVAGNGFRWVPVRRFPCAALRICVWFAWSGEDSPRGRQGCGEPVRSGRRGTTLVRCGTRSRLRRRASSSGRG